MIAKYCICFNNSRIQGGRFGQYIISRQPGATMYVRLKVVILLMLVRCLHYALGFHVCSWFHAIVLSGHSS